MGVKKDYTVSIDSLLAVWDKIDTYNEDVSLLINIFPHSFSMGDYENFEIECEVDEHCDLCNAAAIVTAKAIMEIKK